MHVFHSLTEAIRAGYELFERTPSGYLVRINTANGWALALVDTRARGV